MATIPPNVVRLMPRAMQGFFGTGAPPSAQPLSPHEEAVAGWLRGDTGRLNTLKTLLQTRYDERAKLPVPSTPHDLAVSAGAQHELRQIIIWLDTLYSYPVYTGSEEGE